MRLQDDRFFAEGMGTGWALLFSFWCVRGFVWVKFNICGKGVGRVQFSFMMGSNSKHYG